MPRLSLGLGISSASKLPPTPAAPSGIPVAGTNYVIISGAGDYNGTFQKFNTGTNTNSDWILTGMVYKTPFTTQSNGTILFSPGAYITDFNGEGSVQFGTPYNTWTLISFSYDGEYDSYPYSVVATNTSTDINNIPENSWSPSLSVLSATQIPIGQAAVLSINFANFVTKYNKISNTYWRSTSIGGVNFILSWNTYTANTWVLTGANVYSPGAGDFVATNPSTDSTKIPTLSWNYLSDYPNPVEIRYA